MHQLFHDFYTLIEIVDEVLGFFFFVKLKYKNSLKMFKTQPFEMKL